MRERTAIQKSFERLSGVSCFACGPRHLNPVGLDLVFEETERGARTEFSLASGFQSYPGFLHGGVVSAILDETMAYSGVFKRHALPFTKTLTVNYRAGVPADALNSCESILTEDFPDRFKATAILRSERGRCLCTASAEFVIPTLEMAKRMLPGMSLDGFESFFRE